MSIFEKMILLFYIFIGVKHHLRLVLVLYHISLNVFYSLYVNEETNGIGEAEFVSCAGLKKGDPGGSYGGQGALSFYVEATGK